MPYGISQNQADCSGWATVKETANGYETIACHTSKEDAVKQMVAISISENMEPMGNVDRRASQMSEKRSSDDLELIIQSAMSLLNGALLYLQKEKMEEGIEEEDDGETEDMGEERQAASLVAPAFMRASARRGLLLLEEGYSKVQEEGLKQQTVNDAKKMANGEALSPEKWRKIAPWIARHIVDLDAVKDEPTAGLVAMLLWGGGSSKSSARRAQQYAERIVEKIDTK
jgi:hypothetical protein